MARKSKPSKIPYQCGFCREQLVTVEFGWADYLRLPLLLRPFQCPHCFTCFVRPFSLIGRLPIIGWPFRRGSRGNTPSRPGVLPRRNGDFNGPVIRTFARFGRWVGNCERAIGAAFVAVFRGIWAVIWFLPSLIFGRRRRRSRNRFL